MGLSLTVQDKNQTINRPDSAVRDDVIERLYEVAMDPMRYEELLDSWETMIKPIRKGAHDVLINADINAEFSSHFARADKFLDHVSAGETPDGPIAHIDKTAAFLVGHDLKFADVNGATTSVFEVSKGESLDVLPLESNGLEDLSNLIERMLGSNRMPHETLRAKTDDGRPIFFQLQKLQSDDGPPLIVVISSEINWPDGFDHLLISSFDLTPTEARIMRALAENQSLTTIAENRGRSIDTLRTQLKSVLSKTETHSQTELVRLTLSMQDIASFTESRSNPANPNKAGQTGLRPLPYHRVDLPDGRHVEYLVLGDPAGKPLLFLPQDYGFTRWGVRAEAEAARKGFKVISIVRAGFGSASPLPKKADLGKTVARDIIGIMNHLNIDVCPLLTLGPDVFYAFHLARDFPNRINAIIACGGTFPHDNAEQYERMHKWHRFILASARYTPHLLPFMVKAGFVLARKLGKKGFINAVFGDSWADVETSNTPEVLEAIICGSEICLSDSFTAHKMFAAEAIAQESVHWGGLIEDTKDVVPVYYFNGVVDPQLPYETLKEMMVKYDWINYTVYDDAGQLVFFKKWAEIFPTIEKYL